MREPPLVLVVDDNPANLEILETRLTLQGYQVVTAIDGDEALVVAGAQTPDLILLDVMMPGKDGTEVCRELKRDPGLPFMPVILVTAKADPDDIVAGLDAGGDEYITKPVDHASLVAEIERLGSLKRFLSPQVAELILSTGDERALESHRRDVTVVFCDLRGFTAFAETSEPEEVLGVLRQYHEALG
jgi:adenylate cyclase